MDIVEIMNLLRIFFTTCPSSVILEYPGKKIWCCHGGVPFNIGQVMRQYRRRYIINGPVNFNGIYK